MKNFIYISTLFLCISCGGSSSNVNSDNQVQLYDNKSEAINSSEEPKPEILNFGMNKSKVIWVRADNLTNAVNIVIDGQIIQSKVNLKKNSVTAVLPDSFKENKRVDVSLVDVVKDVYSISLKGMLNVEESYLLNLSRKGDIPQDNTPQVKFSEIDLSSFREEIVLSNFGMNKTQTIWVIADKITESSVILLDTSFLTTKAHLKNNSLTSKLPKSFTKNKKVTMQVVDPKFKLKSNVLNGMLNVDDVYLLNLSKK